jgi:hypothetical protein
MPQSSKIRAQTGPEDGPLITTGYRNSLFAKQGIMNTTDFAIEEKRDDTDQPTVNSGSTQVFYLEKEGTEAGLITLCVTVPALEPLVTGGKTYVRGSDFLGLALLHPIEAVTISYAVNSLDRTFPDKIYKDYKFSSQEIRTIYEAMLIGNKSQPERNTLATAPQNVRIPIPNPWEGQGNQLPICALANKVKITIRFNDAANFIETDGVKPATVAFSNVFLRYELIHMPGPDRAEVVGLTNTAQGLVTLFDEAKKLDFDVPANGLFNTPTEAGYPIDLSDLDGPVKNFVSYIRVLSDVDNGVANPKPYEFDTALLDAITAQVKSNDKILFEPTTASGIQLEHLKKYYGCQPDINGLYCWWNYEPKCPDFASGHIQMSSYTNPRLYLKSTIAHPALRVSVITSSHNWTIQKGGSIQRMWD